jgi:hypothetical protein
MNHNFKNILIVVIILLCLLCINTNEYFFDLKFIHIPKNAGTSIENSAIKKNIKWGFKEWSKTDCNISNPIDIFKCKGKWINLNNNKETNHNKCFPWHQIPDELHSFYENDELFCVVRNPYSKLVSAYNYSHGKNANKEHLNKFIKQKLENFDKNKYWNGCHILPQHYYTHGKRKCDIILKYENLDKEFNDLMKKNNLNLSLPKNNTSRKNVSVKDLNKESIKLINKVYDKDFKLFNYKKLYE